MRDKHSAMAQKAESLEPEYSLDFAGDCWRSPELRRVWEQMVRARDNHEGLYQTPGFFEHLAAIGVDKRLLMVRNPAGGLAGVVPLRTMYSPLNFDVSGRILAGVNLHVVDVLGSQPLMPNIPMLHDHLFTTIIDAFPDCSAIAMGSVPTDSFLWRHCHESRTIRNHFLVHVPYGKRLCHTIPLPATFEDYLRMLSGKKRYNLRRQVRRLRAPVHGTLEMRRIDKPGDIRALIDAVDVLRRGPDGHPSRAGDQGPVIDHDGFADLAQRDMLLCYLLFCGDRPCAVATGTKYGRTYLLDGMIYDESMAALSPGSTLFFLLIEDLIRQGVTLIDFGYGEPADRHRSTNVLVERGTILLLRKTFANRLHQFGHATFRVGINLLKHWRRGARSA